MRYHKSLFARYTRRFVGAVVCYLALAAATTTLVDPWRVLRLPWALERLEDYRDFSDAHRTGKAGLAMDPRGWDVAYIGSSRFEMGLAAEHPSLAGKRVVNLALAGGLIPENTAMARYAMRRNPGLKTLLVGVDSGDLTSRVDLTGQTDFSRSPLAEGQSPVESRLRYLLGVRAFGESCKTIGSHLRGKRSKYTPQGQRVGGLGAYPPVRSYVEAADETYRAQARAFDSPEKSRFNPRKESLLEDFLTEARAAGVEVILAMTPRHALMQVHPASDEPAEAPWERERRALAAMCERINALPLEGPSVRFLDFCTFSPRNTQALPPGDAEFPEWPDLEHCAEGTGDKLLERCFGSSTNSADDWGVDVLATGIDTHLDNLKKGHRRYCRERPQDVAWIRKVLFGGD
jgi:hypothetical protein